MLKKMGGAVVAVAPLTSFAAGIDYSPITSAIDVSTVAVAIVAMAALKAGPNVARWASSKLANFFR